MRDAHSRLVKDKGRLLFSLTFLFHFIKRLYFLIYNSVLWLLYNPGSGLSDEHFDTMVRLFVEALEEMRGKFIRLF